MTKHKLTFLLAAALFALPLLAATPAVRTNADPFIWSSGEYHYDGAGNIISIGASSESGVPDYYTYDAVGRLTAATAHAGVHRNQQSFEYDVYGNLRRVLTNSANGAIVTPPDDVRLDVRPESNRLGDGSGGVCPPNTSCITGRYDEAGNQVAPTVAAYAQVVVANETRLVDPYIYDPLGMMTELRDGTRHEQYLYDANNERIARIVELPGAEERRYTLRSGTSVLREYIQTVPATGARTWQWTEDYIYQGARLLAAELPDNQRRHFHPDHLGTPRLITDDSGYVVAKHTYYPFGVEAPGSTADNERMKFTGHERDFGTGRGQDLDYMHARFYRPVAGRFLTVDRYPADLRRPQSWNRYVYASNNPIVRIDLDGNADFYVTTTFSHDDFHDDRVTDYLNYNATNFDLSNGSATPKSFQKGLSDPDGVSIYFGHSNTTDSLLFNKAGFVPFSNFSNRNVVACISACNSSAIIKDAKVGPGQALIGVTSNLKAGFVKAGDLSYVSTQLIAGLKAGKTVGQVVDGLNKYFADRAKKNPNYKVQLSIKGDRDIVVK